MTPVRAQMRLLFRNWEVVMTKLWLSALVFALTATSVCAQDVRYANGDDNAHYGWADVLRADPVQAVTRTEVPRPESYESSEEQTSTLQSLMRMPYAVFGLNKKTTNTMTHRIKSN